MIAPLTMQLRKPDTVLYPDARGDPARLQIPRFVGSVTDSDSQNEFTYEFLYKRLGQLVFLNVTFHDSVVKLPDQETSIGIRFPVLG